MGTIVNHLLHPLTYQTPSGRTKVLTPADTSFVTKLVLSTLAATIVESRYSSRSLKSSLVYIIIAVSVVFYIATAILKALDRGEFSSQAQKRPTISPTTQSPPVQGEEDFRVKPTWIDDVKYKHNLEKAYFASLWTRMYGKGLDVWIKEVESGDDEKFRNGKLTATPGAPWASFAEHARQKLLAEWENKSPLRRMVSGWVPFA